MTKTALPQIADAAQVDLFGAPLLSGLSSAADFLSATEETALIARIEAAELTPFRFQQWEGKRLTRSYGWHYDFEASAFSRTEPLPKWLRPIADRAADFANIPRDAIAQALLISYGPGAGIGWHRDRGRCSSMSSASRSAPRRRCAFAAGKARNSRASRCRSRRARSII
jgi:alkylated DNA repair dioxygenase AlkB